MRPVILRVKPVNGFSYIFHLLLIVALPIVTFILVSVNFVQLALSLIVLSKWRMFAVRPRFWVANIRANAVDLIVGLSAVTFMASTNSLAFRLMWVILYIAWLLYIKPANNVVMVAAQAFIGQLCALMALYLVWAGGPIIGLTLITGIVCYLAARHFFEAFDEPYAELLSYIWGYFGAALAWLLSHWLLFYHGVSLTAVLLTCLGYGMATLYYLDHYNKLSKNLKRQLIFLMMAIVIVVIAFSGWGDKVV